MHHNTQRGQEVSVIRVPCLGPEYGRVLVHRITADFVLLLGFDPSSRITATDKFAVSVTVTEYNVIRVILKPPFNTVGMFGICCAVVCQPDEYTVPYQTYPSECGGHERAEGRPQVVMVAFETRD
jgi:hypothetical protein